jgi:hypothetical protein
MHQCDPEEARIVMNLVRAHAEVAGVPALHPDFDEADALKQVENRYRRIQAEFPFTLQQLTKDAVFLGLVAELRQEGWKDWHILQAVASARLNALINDEPQSDSLARTIIESGEKEEYPLWLFTWSGPSSAWVPLRNLYLHWASRPLGGLYGGIYFLRTSKAKGKAILLESR